MALTQRNYKFDEDTLDIIEELEAEWKTTATDVIRRSLRFAWTHHRLQRADSEKLAEQLREQLGESATITIRLGDTWAPVVTVDGQPAPRNLYVPTQPTSVDGEDFYWAYLGDRHPESKARIRVGLLPAQAGAAIHVSVKDLGVDMSPRPVAYFDPS